MKTGSASHLVVCAIFGAASLILLCGPFPVAALAPPIILVGLATLAACPQIGYYAMVALIPANSWRALNEEYPYFTISKLLGVLLLIILAAQSFHHPERLKRLRSPIWLPIGLFAAISALSVLYSKYPAESLNTMRQFITACLFLGLTLFFIGPRQLRGALPYVIIGSATVASAIALIGHIFQISSLLVSVEGRAVGVATDPNFFAAVVLASIPLAAHFSATVRSNKIRAMLLLLIIHNSYAIWITYSRGAILVYCVTAVMIAMEFAHKLRPKHVGFPALLLLLGIGAAIHFSPGGPMFERLAKLASPKSDDALTRRLSYLFVARDSLIENPVLGSGPGTFPLVYANSMYAGAYALGYDDYERSAHNTYLELVVGTGLLGILAFLLILASAFKCLFSPQPPGAKGLPSPALLRAYGYSFASFLLSLLFLSHTYHKYIWLFIGAAAAAKAAAAAAHSSTEDRA